MDKTSLQMLFGVLLGVFLLALIVMTVVYVRRKLADKREEALRDLDLMQEEAIREEQSQSKGYWINRDDIEDENQARSTMEERTPRDRLLSRLAQRRSD